MFRVPITADPGPMPAEHRPSAPADQAAWQVDCAAKLRSDAGGLRSRPLDADRNPACSAEIHDVPRTFSDIFSHIYSQGVANY